MWVPAVCFSRFVVHSSPHHQPLCRGGMEMVKADHSCRGSLCCPPAPRTPSQIAAECKRTQEVSWRRLETHQGRVEEGCCPGQREGNVPQAALPSVSEMGTAKCAPSPAAVPLPVTLASTQRGQMASPRVQVTLLVSLSTRAHTSSASCLAIASLAPSQPLPTTQGMA